MPNAVPSKQQANADAINSGVLLMAQKVQQQRAALLSEMVAKQQAAAALAPETAQVLSLTMKRL